MSNYTPGPWFMRTNRHRDTDGLMWGWVDSTDSGSQRPPAGVNVCWTKGKTSHANACLIAAAPELLEALEDLERTAGLPAMVNDPSRVAARAAIAKAKGETK